jgi:diguanylate cyclase (GGDEF)-like protein
MFQHVSIDVLANWVLMLRSDVDGAILLSDSDEEARFYERCASEKARVVATQEVALSLLDRMERRGVHGVVATFRGSQPPPATPNAFRPSIGDVASLLLLSKSCDKVVREICGNPWLKACEKEIGSIRHRVAWVARVLERLRLACTREQVHGPINLEPSEVIDWNMFEVGWDSLVPSLLRHGLPEEVIDEIRAIRVGKDLRSDLLESDGMDAVRVFAAATRLYHPRGIAAYRGTEPDGFIGMLRVAFELSEFEDDEVFWKMRAWERTNARYPLLRQWRMLDPLGVVWDQRYWESDLSAFLNILKPDESLAMFKIDLDNFKQVNENLGHAGGDDAIRLYCEVVKKVFESAGEVYRRGGDEVVVLAPRLSEASARDLAEKARAAVEEVFRGWVPGKGLESAPTASIGLALGNSEESRAQIVKSADEAQRQAKQRGKNRVVVLP